MTFCEMCGRDEPLLGTLVEGVSLNVCQHCARYGVVQQRSVSQQQRAPERLKTEPEFKILENYYGLLRKAREKSAMTQKEFALFLQEKESLINKWEAGTAKPDLQTAQKLQRLLGITLVVLEEAPLTAETTAKTKSTELTLGDFIVIKKR